MLHHGAEVSDNNQILAAILDLKGDLGELKAGQDGQRRWMESHVAEDRLAYGRITVLEMAGAKQRGRSSVFALGATVVGAAIGYAVQLMAAWTKHT